MSLGALPLSVSAAIFATTLQLGSESPDVVALQELLNKSPDTLVASFGPGSPGMETSYFGAKTFDAVKRFQTKYYSEILAPNGLLGPTGIVGPSTRAKLSALAVEPLSTPAAPQTPVTPVATAAPALAQSPMEQYIAEVKKGLERQNESTETIALIEKKIRDTAPEADKLIEDFYKQEQERYKKQVSEADGPVLAFFKSSLITVGSFFVPQTAHAALGLPFGGYVTYITPVCTCTPAVSQVFVTLANANVATSNLLLDYIYGTQAFNWHNLPLPGVATLGIYEPAPICYMFIGKGCVPLPSRGVITPVVGSSLTPL